LNQEEAIVFTGDLNSNPNSNLISYILENQPPELEKMQYKIPENLNLMKEIFLNLKEKNQLIMKFSNAYSHYGTFLVDHNTQYPNYTVYTSHYMETIDHILYSNDKLQIVKLLKIPSPEEINEKELPNSLHPSDHLPLITYFQFLDN